jgi:hypothetical protein
MSSGTWSKNINTITTKQFETDPDLRSGSGLTGHGAYAGMSVFWQFESLDGDLKGSYLSKDSEQALKH